MSVERSHGRSPWREAYELLIQRPERQSAPPESSVSISRNAKGVAQFEVVVRGASPEECQERAFVLYRELVASFPYPVEASVSPQERYATAVDITEPPVLGGRSRAREKAGTA